MKRIIFVVFVLLLLCGCNNGRSEYLVSAMGFDYNEGEYEVCFEAIIVNSENTDQTLKLFKGSGETLEKAIKKIEKQCTRPLLFSHCGVIVVGEKIPKLKFLEVCDYCYAEEEITLSAFFIKTESPETLLSIKPTSSACVGYDIMGLLKQNKVFENRFFEIIKSDYTAQLPKISKVQGGLYFES